MEALHWVSLAWPGWPGDAGLVLNRQAQFCIHFHGRCIIKTPLQRPLRYRVPSLTAAVTMLTLQPASGKRHDKNAACSRQVCCLSLSILIEAMGRSPSRHHVDECFKKKFIRPNFHLATLTSAAYLECVYLASA